MQAVSADFVAAVQAATRSVASVVEVAWDGNTWVDETSYLVSHTGTLRLAAPGDELIAAGEVGAATVTLRNPLVAGQGRRFSWRNAAGPLASYIAIPTGLFGKPVRIKQGFWILPEGYIMPMLQTVTIFTGIIYDWEDDPADNTIMLQLRDMGYKYLQHKASSLAQSDLRADAAIAYYADLAGIPEANRILDTASHHIPYSWLDDESLLEEIWEIARAVGGSCYFDQLGKLRFENQIHWAGQATVLWTFAKTAYKTFRPTYGPDNLANRIVVEWSGRFVGAVDTVYSLGEAKLIRPGETLTFEARFSNPLFGYVALAASDYKVISAGGVDMTSAVTVTLLTAFRYAQRCTVQVVNSHTTLAATLIYLHIRGYPLIGGPTEQVTAEAETNPLPFMRSRAVRGNMYVQTVVLAEALAKSLLGRYQQLAPLWTLRDVPGVPQLELGDRVQCQTSDAIGADVEGFVIEMTWEASASRGFMQSLTLLDAANLFPYTDYYVIGTTPLGAYGRVWY